MMDRSPISKIETLQLWQHAEVGGAIALVPFVREITWRRESETVCKLLHRGAEVDTLKTFNDFYGYLTSLESAAEYAPHDLKRMRIQKGDKLQIVAVTSIHECPYYGKKDAPREWYTSNTPLPCNDDEFSVRVYPRLEPKFIETCSIVLGPTKKLSAFARRWIEQARYLVEVRP
jgi:hypothetical protein